MDNRDLAKQELARKLSAELQKHDMNQSDLARAADIPRELVSTYIRGRSFPTPLSLKRITKALGYKTAEEWLPEVMALQAQDESPSLDIRQLAGHPDKVWLRVNQAVKFHVAARIMQLINESHDAPE